MANLSKSDELSEPRAASATDDGGEHHRSTHRQRTLKAARAVLSDRTMVDCIIRDISKEGARLVFGDAFALPKEFRLLNVSNNTIAPVERLWQRGLNAGVAFTGPEELAPKQHPHHDAPEETKKRVEERGAI